MVGEHGGLPVDVLVHAEGGGLDDGLDVADVRVENGKEYGIVWLFEHAVLHSVRGDDDISLPPEEVRVAGGFVDPAVGTCLIPRRRINNVDALLELGILILSVLLQHLPPCRGCSPPLGNLRQE